MREPCNGSSWMAMCLSCTAPRSCMFSASHRLKMKGNLQKRGWRATLTYCTSITSRSSCSTSSLKARALRSKPEVHPCLFTVPRILVRQGRWSPSWQNREVGSFSVLNRPYSAESRT
ncbi:hypothetical protein M378DRAFT_381759 [Amanita muscaria Koide BX008]|uniref:Uncharacterized protein n=1 Tax=Amanita muscaria (strain Koide BX008) TaxID=946122 RepID=A0A0C2W8Q0_AMAMK|nr:hypothetical protein M378DRAFT_381759 [Amanita muscaria Koide BX008]